MESIEALRKRTEPLVCMLKSKEGWLSCFAGSLIEVAESNTPNQSSKIAFEKCAEVGFHKSIADIVARSTRVLAKIRKIYGGNAFNEAVYNAQSPVYAAARRS